MRASMAFIFKQLIDEPKVPRNFAIGKKGEIPSTTLCLWIESITIDSHTIIESIHMDSHTIIESIHMDSISN